MKKQFLKILILAIVFVSKLTVIAQPAEPGIPLGVSSQLSTSEKSGVLHFTDSAITVTVDGSTDKPVVWKVIAHEGEVYKYNGGEFKISKESGKADGKKFNTLIYQTMPNGLGGALTLEYVCLIKK